MMKNHLVEMLNKAIIIVVVVVVIIIIIIYNEEQRNRSIKKDIYCWISWKFGLILQ